MESATVKLDALTHAEQAMTHRPDAVALSSEIGSEAPARVGDVDDKILRPVPKQDTGLCRAGVFQRVGESLLDDAVCRELHAG